MANPFGKKGWTPDRIGDLSGKVYVITGANSGIGFEAARVLAAKGARQLWLCRNLTKAEDAKKRLLADTPGADISVIQMNLSSLESVRAAATAVREQTDGIDALINNAGIMMVPDRQLTTDGFESQLGVNHLGHFVLDAELADLVEARQGRFVAVSSTAHKNGAIRFDDLMYESGYGAVKVYCQSKLANLLFMLEGNRRLEEAGKTARIYACHPGYAATNLQSTGPGPIWTAVMKLTNKFVAQSAARGGWPTLLAALEPNAEPGGYYGPTGAGEARGPVGIASRTKAARDAAVAKRLWEVSEELTGATWS
jgi:NAD(P)-dependent dehydrogenase (short-subunit alcohol dehydrogenase family)